MGGKSKNAFWFGKVELGPAQGFFLLKVWFWFIRWPIIERRRYPTYYFSNSQTPCDTKSLVNSCVIDDIIMKQPPAAVKSWLLLYANHLNILIYSSDKWFHHFFSFYRWIRPFSAVQKSLRWMLGTKLASLSHRLPSFLLPNYLT